MVMTEMVRVRETITLGAAARLMEAEAVPALLVVDEVDEPIGVLTERHLLAAVAASRHPDHGTARSYMAPVLVDSDGAPRLPDTDVATMVGIAVLRAAA